MELYDTTAEYVRSRGYFLTGPKLNDRKIGFKSHPFQGDADSPVLRDDGSINEVWLGMAGCFGSV
jgi:hypothetical protein